MPPDVIGEPEDKLEVIEDDNKLLSDDVEEQVETDDTGEKVEAEKLEEKPEEEEDEEDLVLEKDAKIPFDRPTIKAIKAEFPEFFNKFPELKESYLREIEFTKIFPTVEDAKEAF